MLPQIIKEKYKNVDRFTLNKLLLYIYGFDDISKFHTVDYFSEENEKKLCTLIGEYKKGKPLEYITNECNFYGLNFFVNENVLIPRIETEILVQMAIDEIGNKRCYVADLCTGSGAIAISVAMKCKNAEFLAVDISKEALAVCEKNISRYNLQGRIKIMECDVLKEFPKNKFNLILANPPYIETNTIQILESSVQRFEPHLALDGGIDGLIFYRKFLESISKNDLCLFEIGYNQGDILKEMYNHLNCDVIKDWNENDRVFKIGDFKGWRE